MFDATKNSPPNFLCIGAQKAGTTWLHAVLKLHPDVWLPHRKEIHYFDLCFPPYQPYPDKVWQDVDAIKSVGDHVSLMKRKLLRLKLYTLNRILWEFHYRFFSKSHDWYKRLFSLAGDKVSGDFTPAYAMLDKKAVSNVHELMPDAKIIYIMRDPIERAWSHAKMMLGQHGGRSASEISDQEYIDFLGSEPSLCRGRYSKTIEIWQYFYEKDNLLLLYFDDIISAPDQFMTDVLQFLDLKSMTLEMKESIHKVIHKGQRLVIPDQVYLFLFNLYEQEMSYLSEYYGHNAINWFTNAKAKKLDIERRLGGFNQ